MATEQTLDEVLEHYGVLGMRWGVRRTPEQLARARGKRLKKGKPVTPTKTAQKRASKYSEDAEKAKEAQKKAKKGGVKTLSNQELRDLTQRMNLEQQYNKLTDKPSKIKKGKKFVDEAVAMGKTANEVVSFVNSPIGKQLRGVTDEKDK